MIFNRFWCGRTLAWEELYELESLPNIMSKPCTTAANVQESGTRRDSGGNGGMSYADPFEAVPYAQLQDLDASPVANKKLPSSQQQSSKLCLIQSAEDAMKMSSTFSSIHQIVKMFLKDETFTKIELIIGDTHCSEDGSKGPDSSCHIKISQAFLSELIREDYSQVEKVSVRWLKEPLVWADISRPARLSYQILEWLAKLDPIEDPDSSTHGAPVEKEACRSALFLTPYLAHFSALARRQRLGLRSTSLSVYFEHTTTSGSATMLREELPLPQMVEQQEVMFMEAMAASLADVTIVDNTALLFELNQQGVNFLPKFMRIPLAKSKKKTGSANLGMEMPGREVYVLPFVGASGSKDASSPKWSVKGLRFDECFTQDNGLSTVLAALELMHSNVTEIREVEISFAGMDAWNSNLKYRGESKPTQLGSDMVKYGLSELKGYKVSVHTTRSEVIKARSVGGVRVIVQFAGSGGGIRAVLEAILQNAPFVAFESTLIEFAKTMHITDRKFLLDLKSRHGIQDPAFDVKGTLLAELLWSKVKDEGSRKDCVASSTVYKIVSQHVFDAKSRLLNLYKKNVLESTEIAPFDKDVSSTMVSVVLVHHNRPDKMQQAVTSINYQNHKKLEIIVLDNASSHPGTNAALDAIKVTVPSIQIIRLKKEVSLSAARNLGAEKATGDYLLFMDDDNIAKTREVEIMLRTALNTNAGIVSSGNQYFWGESSPLDYEKGNAVNPINKWIPLGPSPTLGLYRDVFGDSNALFKKSTFHRYNGFQEHKEINSSWEGQRAKATGEDWELMARMTLGGENLQVVPIPLFWYRLSPDALSKASSRNLYLEKVVSPYLSEVEKHAKSVPELNFVAPALKFAQNAYHKDSLTSTRLTVNSVDRLLDLLRTYSFNKFGHGCTLNDDNKEYDESRNLLKNGDFKDLEIEDARHWQSFGDGYECNRYIEGVKLTSRSISDSYGARQTIELPEKSDKPIFVAAVSTKVNGPPSKDPDGYSIYVDLEYEDKSMGYGYMVTFSRPLTSHIVSNSTSINGMRRWKCGLILPPKPVKKIHFHLLFRHQVGEVIFHKAIVHHLVYQDVCKAYINNPLASFQLGDKKGMSVSNSTKPGNETTSTSIVDMDCQGHFTKQTPILL